MRLNCEEKRNQPYVNVLGRIHFHRLRNFLQHNKYDFTKNRKSSEKAMLLKHLDVINTILQRNKYVKAVRSNVIKTF